MDDAGVTRANQDESRLPRLGRGLASPTGILIILPALVIAAGVTIFLLGHTATHEASDSLARDQLATQAADVAHDVDFTLDQAGPMLDRLRPLADPALAIADVASRMHDLQIARPGVVNVSIGFPSGLLRGTYVEAGQVRVQESVLGPTGTTRTNYAVVGRDLRVIETKQTDYDVRQRPHYLFAQGHRARAWMPPRVYFTSRTTGVTCAEPIYATDGALVAVTTVDFDVAALSEFVVRAPLPGARSVLFAGDGTILAFPSMPTPQIAASEHRLLRYTDYPDPALAALFAIIGETPVTALGFRTVHTDDGDYLVSLSPLAGKRAGVPAPIDWYFATLVPERVLLGPTHRLERRSLIASAGALAIAVAIALVFAWNLVRMRRAIEAARARARSAETRAKDLGSYRLVEKLGAGGMGEVWRAEHRLLARQAAIKLVRPESLEDPVRALKLRERFRREAQTLAHLRSRHTIALFDYGVADDGTFFYVMELLDGLDFDKVVRQHGAQPAARVIHMLAQACHSLAEAHDAGLMHRDIKPANLFLAREGDDVDIVKLLDFGIVRSFAEPAADPVEVVALPTAEERVVRAPRLTRQGAVVGTTGFIAPEQVDRAGEDGRSDLYALGCVAWWLLAGDEVFVRSPDDQETLRAHVEQPVPELAPRVDGWLPAELEVLVRACLAKDPERRPANARALANALRAIPIPDEHAWTEARAQAWWYRHQPAPVVVEEPPVTEQRLLVSGRDDKRA